MSSPGDGSRPITSSKLPLFITNETAGPDLIVEKETLLVKTKTFTMKYITTSKKSIWHFPKGLDELPSQRRGREQPPGASLMFPLLSLHSPVWPQWGQTDPVNLRERQSQTVSLPHKCFMLQYKCSLILFHFRSVINFSFTYMQLKA